jgi:hypothetical protein
VIFIDSSSRRRRSKMAQSGYSIETLIHRGILEAIDGKYISEVCRERSLALNLSEHTVYKMISWGITHGYIAKKHKDGFDIKLELKLTKFGEEELKNVKTKSRKRV